jgi:iron(III) transport system ATP-binding protein
MDKLSVDNLFLSYGDNPILKGVSFELNPGEVVCLLGASGSGKTTLLRAVAGLEQPSSGRIELDGKVFFDGASKVDLPVEQRSLGLVFQSYALWPHRTVADNVGYGLKLRRVSSAEQKKRVQSALDQLGLGHLAARYPYQLSGGQQQLVGVARAVILHPKLLLADEPTGNLHSAQGQEIMELFKKLNDAGTTIIQVTHSERNAAYGNRIIQLKDGWVVSESSPAAVQSA